jgi:hypothetical protein
VHVLTHIVTSVTFGALSYGHVDGESYGYAGGVRLAPLYYSCQASANVHDDG